MNTLKFSAALFILLLGFVSFANAHMQFLSPKSRGHDEDTISQAPCGGYNDVVASAVTDFPVTTGQATIDFEDGNGVMIINFAKSISDVFVPVSDNVTINTPSEKQFTTPVDLSKAGAKVGDKGVLQAIYIGAETWYQCADINVVDAKPSPSEPNKTGASSFVGTSEVAYFVIVLVTFVMALN